MALQRALAVGALRTGSRGLGDPGRAAQRSSGSACPGGGEDLKARAEVWASATVGPNTAGGQSYRCADAGAGMMRTVRPVPVRESDRGLQLAARPSWRQLWQAASSRGRATRLPNSECAS